jgi:glutamyl-tRNA synthetase
MDSLEGITHAMRTKEYELRDELYFAILTTLELRKPRLIEFSRLSIKGAPVSKRLIAPLIEQKRVEGWDDPRLPTLSGLARRGILPEALKTFVLSFGLTKVESEPNWDALLAENRKLLDERCMRRYFVRAPCKLIVEGAPPKEAEVANHPKNPAMGKRKITAASEFWIAGADAEALSVGETFRLKELYNLILTEKQPGQLRAKYDADEGLAAKKMQWVPVESAVNCKVKIAGDLLDEAGSFRENSMSEDAGFCETSCCELAAGDIVQLERYGYARLDKQEEHGLVFIFSC